MPLDKKKDMSSHYSEHDIAEKFDRFLKSHRFTPKHKEEGRHFTHTEMNTCKGSYYINDEDYTEFVRLYKEFIHSGWEIGMVERHDDKKVGPLVCDFDFRSRKEYRSYTQEHIKNIITIFVDVMRDIFYIGDENQLQAFVYEKDTPTMDKKNNDTQYKDGFHIFWPYAPMLVEYRYLLYEIVIDRLKREKTLDDIPSIEPLTEVFDSRVIYSNGMMMYGSTKPGRSPYELTHVYNDDLTEIDIYEFDFDTKIETSLLRSYDDDASLELKTKHKSLINKCIEICNKRKYKTEFKKFYGSTESNYDVTSSDNTHDTDESDNESNESDSGDDSGDDSDDDSKKNNKSKKNNTNKSRYDNILKTNDNNNKCNCCGRNYNNIPKNSDYIIDLVSCLSRKRSNSYDDWIRVGWCLNKIWHGFLPEYIKFSKLSKKYEPGCCERIWRSANSNTAEYNLPSLILWAKQDDPEKFSEVFKSRMNDLLKKAMSSTHDDIANVLKEMYGNIYVCASIKDNVWYEFRDHRWVNTQNAYTLSERISDEVCAEFANNNSDRANGGLNVDHRDNDEIRTMSKKLFSIYNNLKNVSFKECVLKACRNKFFDPKFEEKLDKNTKLIGFDNGVFDLNTMSFREGVPEDNLTFTTGYDFQEFTMKDEKIKEIEEYFLKVQTNPETREWLLRLIATNIDGSTKNQYFIFWPGSGGNGKSTTIDLIKYTFGEYSCPLPVKVLTGQTPDATVATPALSDKKGKRFVPVNEPAHNDILNVATMKLFTGNDEVPARGLYQEMFYFKPQFKMVLACNKLPRIKDLDNGCWRRIKVLPFSSCFVDKPRAHKPNEFKKDPDLIDGKLETWKVPFMWYLLRVIYPRYLDDENKCKGSGLKIPAVVEQETEKYRIYSDKYFEFLKLHTIKATDEDKEDIKTLYPLYKEWFREAYGDRPANQKEFVEYFIQYDYKIVNDRYLYGYKLKDDNDEELN